MRIHDRAFEGLKNISNLIISESNLFSPPVLQLISGSLKLIQMSAKNIENIPNDYFNGCTHLETIGIINSNIQRVPNLNDTHSTLKQLHLFNNNITDIRQLYGLLFPALMYLDLSDNKILDVDAHLMTFPVISFISLNANCLDVLPDLTQSGWGKDLSEKKTVTVSIANGNPWHCSADMLRVIDMTCTPTCTTKHPHRIEIGDLDKMICHTPTSMAGKAINEVGKLNYFWFYW